MKARLINCSLPTLDIQASRVFYEGLLGVSLARSMSEWLAFYAWASAGVKLTINDPNWKSNGPVLTFAVEDLDAATKDAVSAGGRILAERVVLEIPERVFDVYSARFEQVGLGAQSVVEPVFGVMNVVADPAGNVLSLMKLSQHAEAFFEEGNVSTRDIGLHNLELTFAETALRKHKRGKRSSGKDQGH